MDEIVSDWVTPIVITMVGVALALAFDLDEKARQWLRGE